MNSDDGPPEKSRSAARAAAQRLEDLARQPYVQGLPEWSMFPDDEARRRAIQEIERGMMPRSIKGVLQFFLAVALFLCVPALASYSITQYVLPPLGPWNDRIMWLLALGGYTVIVYLAIRKNMPKALRQQLLTSGVPICLDCGYDLRGLPADGMRCPECGHGFDAQTARLVREASAASASLSHASSGPRG